MKIGRNAPCPCGSGKKYKFCCMINSTLTPKQLLKKAVSDAGYSTELADVLCNLDDYMKQKQWWGACHASCSALYVAISELGYHPQLCIGELMGQGLYFDHSWIELDGEILDMAISMTLMGGAPASEPIFNGKNVKTGMIPVIEYGVPGRGIEGETLFVKNTPFVEYMDLFPNEKNGLWDLVSFLLGYSVDIPKMKVKYANVERIIVRKEKGESEPS